ncbi:MAG: tetratricopeptide repeat protein [Sandaracinaceae bacterium]|nr:tetratricopeptide repeat protein [Sandaracinaceae bacterium]
MSTIGLATGTLATGTLATGTLATGTLATGTLATGTLATGTLATGTLAIATTALWLPSSAKAQEQSPSERRDTEARLLFEAGRLAFSEGRFDEALGHFRRAYELSERPDLLYNVGTAADRAGQREEAVAAYEQYLATAADIENRPIIESRLVILRREIAELQAARDAQRAPVHLTPEDTVPVADPNVAVAPAVRADEGEPIAAIALFAGAGATGIAAITVGILTLDARATLLTACTGHVCADPALRSRGEEMSTMALVTDVLSGASLALAVGAVLALVLTPSSESEHPLVRATSQGIALSF